MRTGKPLPALFRRSLQRSRHVVANSEEASNTLTREHAIAADKITVIRNSLVFPATAAGADPVGNRADLRAKHAARPTTTVLVCVAMFRPEKNQRELVEIVSGLPPEADWQLWLAGDGPSRPECEQLVATKKLGERIKFLGFERDPTPLYQAADVAVHASWSEALSNFLIEAQAHGLPYVAYEAQGIRECGLPGQTGWTIPRDDRTAFRAALMGRIAAAPADRQRVSEQAREFARTAFDPQRQVAGYLELFARLTGEPAGAIKTR
jgi:glycosyltransferase involved in cell wall biosynthesis